MLPSITEELWEDVRRARKEWHELQTPEAEERAWAALAKWLLVWNQEIEMEVKGAIQ